MQLDFVLKMAKNQNSGKMAKMAFETVVETLQGWDWLILLVFFDDFFNFSKLFFIYFSLKIV